MNRKISTSKLPKSSKVLNFITKIDYEDTFAVALQNKDIAIEDVYLNVFAHSPKWVNNLLQLRNKIVNFFGIKTTVGEMKKENLKVGEKTGIFKIYALYNNELIAGEDEKHLDFRISILKNEGLLTISTLVHYNNWFGRLYFFIIKPFHKMVAKSMMKSAVTNNRI
ncbi:hypothetical protein MNBD_BACTEROID03-734 [hydrothermal vent metagenome]|uniref:DUF2867 domain-containing protein n=1 Tax=hydrothermal vent metagenome TaxID=652676 RepID=A0A3B0T8G5_9ZZZZ